MIDRNSHSYKKVHYTVHKHKHKHKPKQVHYTVHKHKHKQKHKQVHYTVHKHKHKHKHKQVRYTVHKHKHKQVHYIVHKLFKKLPITLLFWHDDAIKFLDLNFLYISKVLAFLDHISSLAKAREKN